MTLTSRPHIQVLLTTHSSYLVKLLNFDNIRLVKNNGGAKEISKIEVKNLPYPSLNEVNHLAFGDVSSEYHNELYGFIESENWLSEYEKGKQKMQYNKIREGKKNSTEQVVLSKYIRHQIHHPENKENKKYTPEQLKESINLMRSFIKSENQTPE